MLPFETLKTACAMACTTSLCVVCIGQRQIQRNQIYIRITTHTGTSSKSEQMTKNLIGNFITWLYTVIPEHASRPSVNRFLKSLHCSLSNHLIITHRSFIDIVLYALLISTSYTKKHCPHVFQPPLWTHIPSLSDVVMMSGLSEINDTEDPTYLYWEINAWCLVFTEIKKAH